MVKIVCLAIFGAALLLAGTARSAPSAKRRPPVNELVDGYLQAAGVAALKAVHTRSCMGDVSVEPSGMSAGEGVQPFQGKLELDWKEPGRAREIWSNGKSRIRRISDGEHGWEVGLTESRRELRVGERVELSRLAALYQPAALLSLDELTFERADKVGERPVYVLKTKSGELLWLDQETHLPLRLDLLVERLDPSRQGEFYLSQIFFEDWQPVAPAPATGAMQLPHLIRRVLAQETLVYKLSEVKQDLDLADSLFKIPYFWRK